MANFILSQEKLKQLSAQLYHQDQSLFPYPWTSEDWSNLYKQDRFKVFVVQYDNDIAGFALFELFQEDHRCELLKVLVKPRFRGINCASSLLRYCFSHVELRNLKRCLLEVGEENESAINLYSALGFRKLRVQKNFYSDGCSGITMELQISMMTEK